MLSLEDSSSPFEQLRQIDACCRDYENAWQTGSVPKFEEYLQRMDGDARQRLLSELLIIELNYRRNGRGKRLTREELISLHPELSDQIINCFSQHDVRDAEITARHHDELAALPSTGPLESTQLHQPRTGSSRGLHIRCPHCSNPVELLGDTSFDSIICQTCGSAFSLVNENEATQQAPILRQIGRFEIVGRLGVGGFGTVWKARDPELERAVAVKIPRKGQLDRDEIEDFLKEARTTAQLHHPHIVPVYEVGKDGDTVFIVSELIRGVSLSDWLSGASPDFRQIAELLARVADALDHAHKKGVIHRDLKPSNILIDETGQPNVMDFGLAKRDGLEITMTVDGQVLGTPAYMSPEQAAGKSNWTDCRMDIYSFGVVLFRMLTGELPYRGNAQMQIHQRLTQDAPDPRGLNRYVPRDLATICLKCLERDPNGRYSTAKQVAGELERFLRGEPILARPISKTERILRWGSRHPAVAAAALLFAILAIGGPTAAVVIDQLRQRQVKLVEERDNLIKQREAEMHRAINRTEELQAQLDIWTGRANPWDLWPPSSGNPPKRIQLQALLQERGDELRRVPGQETKLEKSRRVLALATIYEDTNYGQQAKAALNEAAAELQDVLQSQPDLLQVQLALADCYDRLAALTTADEIESETWIQQALVLRRKLAEQHPDDSLVQALRVDAELRSSVATGFANASQQLGELAQVQAGLAQVWPTTTADLYELACQLSGRTPWLMQESIKPADSIKASSD